MSIHLKTFKVLPSDLVVGKSNTFLPISTEPWGDEAELNISIGLSNAIMFPRLLHQGMLILNI